MRSLTALLAVPPTGGRKVEERILSPDGALCLVPWQALPLEDGGAGDAHPYFWAAYGTTGR